MLDPRLKNAFMRINGRMNMSLRTRRACRLVIPRGYIFGGVSEGVSLIITLVGELIISLLCLSRWRLYVDLLLIRSLCTINVGLTMFYL